MIMEIWPLKGQISMITFWGPPGLEISGKEP